MTLDFQLRADWQTDCSRVPLGLLRTPGIRRGTSFLRQKPIMFTA